MFIVFIATVIWTASEQDVALYIFAVWININQRIVADIGIEVEALWVEHSRLCNFDRINASESSLRIRIVPRAKVIQPRLIISLFTSELLPSVIHHTAPIQIPLRLHAPTYPDLDLLSEW